MSRVSLNCEVSLVYSHHPPSTFHIEKPMYYCSLTLTLLLSVWSNSWLDMKCLFFIYKKRHLRQCLGTYGSHYSILSSSENSLSPLCFFERRLKTLYTVIEQKEPALNSKRLKHQLPWEIFGSCFTGVWRTEKHWEERLYLHFLLNFTSVLNTSLASLQIQRTLWLKGLSYTDKCGLSNS